MAAVLEKATDTAKAVTDYSLEELKALARDYSSPFFRGPDAKALQARYHELQAKGQAPGAAPSEVRPVPLNSLQLEEFKNYTWRLDVSDVPPEHFEEPEFWTLAGVKLNPYDRVFAVDAKRRTWTELLVVYAEQGYTPKLKLLRSVAMGALPEKAYKTDAPRGFRVEYDEGTRTYSAIRESDGKVLVRELPDRETCLAELRNHASVRGPNHQAYYP